MAIELAVDLTVPVQLPALLSTAQALLSELLGLTDAPAFDVAVGRRRDQGVLAEPGRRATPDEVEAIEIGPGRRPADWEVVDEAGATLVLPLVTPFDHDVRLTLEPRRDARGIVTALSLALAAALLGDTTVIDTDIGLIDTRTQPAAFVHAWRLHPEDGPISETSLRFLRQFEATRNWPSH
jgi:hypothetical protein